jgi:cytoskeleton protein RodZ
MKSISDILKEERLAKSYTLEQIVVETHIPKQYLKAMEENDFDAIPGGESNLLGFLRMYTLFLGLDVEKVLVVYKNHKLIEEQAPYEELLKRERNWVKIGAVTAGVLIGALLIFMAVINIFNISIGSDIKRVNLRSDRSREVKRTLKLDQTMIVSVDGVPYTLLFERNNLGEVQGLIRGEDQVQDFVLSRVESFQTVLSTLSYRVENSLILKISLLEEPSSSRLRLGLLVEQGVSSVASVEDQGLTAESAGRYVDGRDRPTRQVVMSVRSGIAVNPIISFRGYVYYRHRLDNGEVVENYFQAGDQIQRTMHSNMKIWVSNAGRTQIRIGLNEFTMGRDGEVAVKLLYWQRNATTGMLDLILEDV